MKNLRKIGLGLVALLLSISLVACGSTKEEQKQEAAKQQEQQLAEKAKKEYAQKISKLESRYKDYTKEKGYMGPEDFGAFREDFNILAKSIKSTNILEHNDDEIDDHLKELKGEVTKLKDDQIIKAKERYGSAKDVYEAVMGSKVHYLLRNVDTNYYGNELRAFSNKRNADEGSVNLEKIDIDAKEAIKSIQDYPMDDVKELKNKLEEYKSSFSDEQYNELYLAFLSFSSSLEKQVSALQKLQIYYINDGTDVGDNIEDAQTFYSEAKDKISNFETELEVEIAN
ncbi:hypothetical protein WKH56_06240 [Priestia sp. SB1]|uniref:hypothetical protein n=1 Tax=Priestia sp. SB1 TaxID=3132359 RepID=UPI003177FD64